MKKLIPAFLLIMIAFSNVSGEQLFPPEATYRFYINGEYAGSNKFTVNEKGGTITFESSVKIDFEDYHYDLSSITEADPTTFQTIQFTYKGKQLKTPISGKFFFYKDSIAGTTEIDGNKYPYKSRPLASNVYILQQYLMEHHILLAKAFLAMDKYSVRFATFLPVNTLSIPTTVIFESEREISTGEKAILCKKLLISGQNSDPVYSYIDQAENLPILIVFPTTRTEAFLESYFGEHPTSMFETQEEETETPKN